MKTATSSEKLTPTQRAELEALAELRDDQINTKDIPEQHDWRGARRGMFYRPVKQQLTLRLDADTVAWFRSHCGHEVGYQTCINMALREYVVQHSYSDHTESSASARGHVAGAAHAQRALAKPFK
jgi:uncharacterized protein (DUF4415 family)